MYFPILFELPLPFLWYLMGTLSLDLTYYVSCLWLVRCAQWTVFVDTIFIAHLYYQELPCK